MEDRNKNNDPGQKVGMGHGMQGMDKAPGEEPSQDNVQFQQETQKGKKVDADLSKEQDRPAEQNDPLL